MSTPIAERVVSVEAERSFLVEDRLYTAEELLEVPADAGRTELRQGKLTTKSFADRLHGQLTMQIGTHLYLFVNERSLGIVFAAGTGFQIETNPDTVLAPDISFVQQYRLPDGQVPEGYFPGPPDLAVEVISPEDLALAVQSKIQEWLIHGTKLVWIVEPDSRTVNVYRADGSAALLGDSATLDGEDVLPGFTMKLENLFR